MIRVVMFDLGLTLIDRHNRPFDHVPEALTAISKFKTADGKVLRCCLVSDFTLATPPVTAAKVRQLFEEYLDVLDETGLRSMFEPVQRRVTLSTHAGAQKPDRAVFETALRRLRVHATLAECLFITENTAHIKAARTKLRMKALQFSATGSRPFDFDDWAQAPALVAHLVDPQRKPNLRAAVEMFLTARGVEVTALKGSGTAGTFTATGRVWSPISVRGVGGRKPVHVAVPVHGVVTIGSKGALRSKMSSPTDGDIEEASAFATSLATHGQIAKAGAPRSAGATHEIEVDGTGQQRLVRKRFSAV
jgi:FMN phosphatase YigB (HAD superfamily)